MEVWVETEGPVFIRPDGRPSVLSSALTHGRTERKPPSKRLFAIVVWPVPTERTLPVATRRVARVFHHVTMITIHPLCARASGKMGGVDEDTFVRAGNTGSK